MSYTSLPDVAESVDIIGQKVHHGDLIIFPNAYRRVSFHRVLTVPKFGELIEIVDYEGLKTKALPRNGLILRWVDPAVTPEPQALMNQVRKTFVDGSSIKAGDYAYLLEADQRARDKSVESTIVKVVEAPGDVVNSITVTEPTLYFPSLKNSYEVSNPCLMPIQFDSTVPAGWAEPMLVFSNGKFSADVYKEEF